MPYTPRTALDILRNLRGAIVGRTDLNDINPSSALNVMLSAFSEEMASSERRLYMLRESFFLNGATGSDLDQRVAELPAVGISRLQASNASGSCLRIERAFVDTTDALIIPAGSTVTSTTGVTYVTTEVQVIPAGEIRIENVHIVARTVGTGGNVGVGDISGIAAMPPEVTLVTNTQAITNGRDRETDDALRSRALKYMKSLSRSQKNTLEFMAQSFTSSRGERYPYARLYEDETTPGYCELLIDDGSGLTVESMSKPGVTAVNRIGAGGQAVVFHQAPATAPIEPGSIIIAKGGDLTQQVGIGSHEYTSIPERGIIYLKAGMVERDDVVYINNYRVFTGFISELQREIEGDPNDYTRLTGFRAAGVRVVVMPVTPQYVNLAVSILATQESDYAVVEQRAKLTIETYINNLNVGEVLYISKLIDEVSSLVGVQDVKFYDAGTGDRAENIAPSTSRIALRVREGSITITAAL